MRFRFKDEMAKYYTEHRKLDAQKVGDAISKLNGDAELIVEAARPPRHVLHNGFDWEDKEAAHKWRLTQARHLVAAIITEVPGRNGPQDTRAFVSVQGKRGFEYKRIDHIMGDSDLRIQVLRNALDDVRIFRRRYDSLGDVLGTLAEIEQALVREIDRTERTSQVAA